jgi:hypothetical protein
LNGQVAAGGKLRAASACLHRDAAPAVSFLIVLGEVERAIAGVGSVVGCGGAVLAQRGDRLAAGAQP